MGQMPQTSAAEDDCPYRCEKDRHRPVFWWDASWTPLISDSDIIFSSEKQAQACMAKCKGAFTATPKTGDLQTCPRVQDQQGDLVPCRTASHARVPNTCSLMKRPAHETKQSGDLTLWRTCPPDGR